MRLAIIADESMCVGKETIASMPGWRFAFLSVAFVSLLIGTLTLILGKEPRNVVEKEGGVVAAKESIKLSAIPGHMLSVMKVPTFSTIVLQVRHPARLLRMSMFNRPCNHLLTVFFAPNPSLICILKFCVQERTCHSRRHALNNLVRGAYQSANISSESVSIFFLVSRNVHPIELVRFCHSKGSTLAYYCFLQAQLAARKRSMIDNNLPLL